MNYPITVISGPNGSGKSTYAHAALCAFKQSIAGAKNYNLNNFFVKSVVDDAIFNNNTDVSLAYTAPPDQRRRNVRLFRNFDRWRGYDRRPSRGVVYIGLFVYLPKVERRDLAFYARTRLRRGARREIPDDVRRKINYVLNANYRRVDKQTLIAGLRSIDVYCVERSGNNNYSESNMGLGEGRAINMIMQIEEAPPRSLIVIDEPEIALHEAVQVRLARYFADASDRLGHQFLLTSHSSAILNELPHDALVYLERRGGRVITLRDVTFHEARALLSEGQNDNRIWVEDECAKAVVENLLRRGAPPLLSSCSVHVLSGGADAIRKTMQRLQEIGIARIAVLDGDQMPDPAVGILKLPGTTCPEREVFSSQGVRDLLQNRFQLGGEELDDLLDGKNPHSFFYDVAKRCLELEETLRVDCVRAYVDTLLEDEVAGLVTAIRGRLRQMA